MKEQNCILPPCSDLLSLANTNTTTSEPSATSKDTPFSEGTSFSQIPGRSGSVLAEPQSFLFTPTFPGSINPYLHGSTENTRLQQTDAHDRAVETVISETTPPLVYYQQSHPAASLALASPAAQVPVKELSKKRRRLPNDYISGNNGPLNNRSSPPASAGGKNRRVSQACESCRRLKAKCDGTTRCKSCKERNCECIYADPAPKATKTAHADCSAKMGQIEKRLIVLEAHLPKDVAGSEPKLVPKTTETAHADCSAKMGQIEKRLIVLEAHLSKDVARSEPKPDASVEDKDGRAPVLSIATNDPSAEPANFRTK